MYIQTKTKIPPSQKSNQPIIVGADDKAPDDDEEDADLPDEDFDRMLGRWELQ